MDKKLGLILFVLLISVASATAILSDIYVYEDFYGGGFCYKNNTIFPCTIVNPNTLGAYMIESSDPIFIDGDLKVKNKIIGYNTTTDLDNRYFTQTQIDNDSIVRNNTDNNYHLIANNVTTPILTSDTGVIDASEVNLTLKNLDVGDITLGGEITYDGNGQINYGTGTGIDNMKYTGGAGINIITYDSDSHANSLKLRLTTTDSAFTAREDLKFDSTFENIEFIADTVGKNITFISPTIRLIGNTIADNISTPILTSPTNRINADTVNLTLANLNLSSNPAKISHGDGTGQSLLLIEGDRPVTGFSVGSTQHDNTFTAAITSAIGAFSTGGSLVFSAVTGFISFASGDGDISLSPTGGIIKLNSDVDVGGNLDVTGNATIGENLDLAGTLTNPGTSTTAVLLDFDQSGNPLEGNLGSPHSSIKFIPAVGGEVTRYASQATGVLMRFDFGSIYKGDATQQWKNSQKTIQGAFGGLNIDETLNFTGGAVGSGIDLNYFGVSYGSTYMSSFTSNISKEFIITNTGAKLRANNNPSEIIMTDGNYIGNHIGGELIAESSTNVIVGDVVFTYTGGKALADGKGEPESILSTAMSFEAIGSDENIAIQVINGSSNLLDTNMDGNTNTTGNATIDGYVSSTEIGNQHDDTIQTTELWGWGGSVFENLVFVWSDTNVLIGSDTGILSVLWDITMKMGDNKAFTFGSGNDFSMGYDAIKDLFVITEFLPITAGTPLFTLDKLGNTNQTGNATIGGDLDITGDLNVTGNANIVGNLTIHDLFLNESSIYFGYDKENKLSMDSDGDLNWKGKKVVKESNKIKDLESENQMLKDMLCIEDKYKESEFCEEIGIEQ